MFKTHHLAKYKRIHAGLLLVCPTKDGVSILCVDGQLPREVADLNSLQAAAGLAGRLTGFSFRAEPQWSGWITLTQVGVVEDTDSVFVVYAAYLPEVCPVHGGEWTNLADLAKKLAPSDFNQVTSMLRRV